MTPTDVGNRTYTVNNTQSLLTITKSYMFHKITDKYLKKKKAAARVAARQ
jgi:hypothetical protein